MRKRELEEKESIAAEAKKTKEGKMKRLSNFLGKIRPTKGELESKGIISTVDEIKVSEKKERRRSTLTTFLQNRPPTPDDLANNGVVNPSVVQAETYATNTPTLLSPPVVMDKNKRKSLLFSSKS